MSENKILRDLTNGVNPEKTLAGYAKVLSDGYFRLSHCKLAVNLTTYYDDLENTAGLDADIIKEEFEKILDIMDSGVVRGEINAENTESLTAVREEVISRMKTLYDYVHVLGIYEHVFNRLQYSFEERLAPVRIDVLMQEIDEYVHQDKDPSGVNQRIQNIYGEMPVRITKSLFLDMVKTGCNYYAGTRNDMVDYFFNEMYDQAGLPKSDQLSEDYAELHDITSDLERIDYKNITEEQMKNAMAKLEIAGQKLSQTFSYDFQLLELINDLMIILLCRPYADADHIAVKTAARCIHAYMKAASDKDFIGMDENIVEDVTALNGQQESLVGLHMLFEDQLINAVQKYKNEIISFGYKAQYDALRLSCILSGIDLMADLDAEREIFVTDKAYIEEKTEKLIELYRNMFAEYPIILRRAVIADALSKLPISCNSTEECIAFIRQNIESCKDASEIYASALLIRQIIGDKTW